MAATGCEEEVPENIEAAPQLDSAELTRLKDEEAKTLVSTVEVARTTGPELEAWKLAAEAELANFTTRRAFHVSSREEREVSKPLPMTCVWTRSGTGRKCRACVCGNFENPDPEMRAWTAQAEPSSLLASLKVGSVRGWMRSKHDLKGAFLYADVPEGRVVVISPPSLWVKWGLVEKGVTWTLDKAVYGLRESPAWWSAERDRQLRRVTWVDPSTGREGYLEQTKGDSQVWLMRLRAQQAEGHDGTLQGLLVVYVDDFLLQTEAGKQRDAFLAALSSIWSLAKEAVLDTENPITFLGIRIRVLEGSRTASLAKDQMDDSAARNASLCLPASV